MNTTFRRFALLTLLFVPFLLPSATAAQAYPSKPIHIVAPFPPGGNLDFVARLVGGKLSKLLHVPVIVDNRPGAASVVAMGIVARSAPDGYTILLNTNGEAIIPELYHKLSFNPVTDLAPVTQLTTTTLILVASKKCPARTVKQLVALARAKPGKLNFGSTGPGAILQLGMDMLTLQTGTNMVAIPYKGAARIDEALLQGQIDVAIVPLTAALPHIKAGTLHALAVTGRHRSPLLPNVPTVAQAGLPGYEATSWQGFFAPAKTPPGVIRKIQRATARALKMPDVRGRLGRFGDEIVGSTPAQFEARLVSDRHKFAKLIKEAHVPMQD